MKKNFINVILVFLIFFLNILQSYFFNSFTIAGIKPNLLIILIVFISMFATKRYGLIYGIIIGLSYDLVFGRIVGIAPILYGLIGVGVGTIDKNFSKDNKLTILLTVTLATLFYDIALNIINYVAFKFDFNLLSVIKMMFIEILYNCLITIILYPIIQKFGFYIENEFKQNRILTRYF